jgi:NAD(P)-dependent dehydrogenase (short-subunit alcohol dehydrogenase family)
MRGQHRGDIVMISSIAVLGCAAGGAPYVMAKAALEALAWTLANEEAANGIRVNVVAPGLVATEMGDRLARAMLGIDRVTDLDSEYPFGRAVRPEDVASVVRFLVSDEATAVTGQRLFVHGGKRDLAPQGYTPVREVRR